MNNKIDHDKMKSTIKSKNKSKSNLTKITPKVNSMEELDAKIKRLQEEEDERKRLADYEVVIVHNALKVRIREYPKMDSQVLRTVKSGQELRLDENGKEDYIVFGEEHNGNSMWYRVIIDNRIVGYINRHYAKTKTGV